MRIQLIVAKQKQQKKIKYAQGKYQNGRPRTADENGKGISIAIFVSIDVL